MSEIFLHKVFQAYYKAHKNDFPNVPTMSDREFAFLYWNRPGMIRHIMYPSKELLVNSLISRAPRHSYRSASYYERPGADKMDKKGYKGCDFVVDIDADHIYTPCRNKHNYAICKQCGLQIQGENPEKCPDCESTKFNKLIWICKDCLEVSKTQVFNFVDNFLTKDFGIGKDQFTLFFSGHRGYHIHLDSDAFRGLDQDARREITDYVTGYGFSFKLWNYGPTQKIMQGFLIDQPGWPGKIAREFQEILSRGPQAITESFGSYFRGAALLNRLIEKRQYLLEQLQKKNRTWAIPGWADGAWQNTFEALRDRIKSDIDIVVSIDLHRLIRLDGSLHGKTGFVVQELKYADLSDYDPLVSAISFPGSGGNELQVVISTEICPEIRIEDQTYGPFVKDEKIKLPLNVALFLLCKNVANLVRK